jgi:hypothetical protein
MNRNLRGMLVGGAVIAGMSLTSFPATAFQPGESTTAKEMGNRWGNKCAGSASCCSSQRNNETACKGTPSPLAKNCEDAEKICRTMTAEVPPSPKDMGKKWSEKCIPNGPIGCCSKQRNDETACKGTGSPLVKNCEDAEKICQTMFEEAKRAEDEKRKKAVQQATLPSPSQAVQNLKTQREQDLKNTEEEYNKAMDALRPAKSKREVGEWEQ